MPRAIFKRNLQFSRMVFLVSEHYEVPLTEKKIKMGKKQHQKDKLYVNYRYFFVYVFSIMSFVETWSRWHFLHLNFSQWNREKLRFLIFTTSLVVLTGACRLDFCTPPVPSWTLCSYDMMIIHFPKISNLYVFFLIWNKLKSDNHRNRQFLKKWLHCN